MTIQPSSTGKTLLFLETLFVDGFETSNKIGFLRFDPSVFPTIQDAMGAARQLNWKFSATPDEDGFYKVSRA